MNILVTALTKRAIVRPPPNSFSRCISSHPDAKTVDLDLARAQHKKYCQVLQDHGLEIIELQPEESQPDCCFVEDTAVIVGQKALITRMRFESRRGEENTIEEVLSDYLNLHRVSTPGHLEGGDVIHCEDFLICGESSRTNDSGIKQMESWLEIPVMRVFDSRIIHLKSHATYLGEDTIVVTPEYANHPVFDRFTKVVLPLEEAYAANTLAVNGSILMSARHPESCALVRGAGFKVIELNMSEFEKCEGALTCLSLLF